MQQPDSVKTEAEEVAMEDEAGHAMEDEAGHVVGDEAGAGKGEELDAAPRRTGAVMANALTQDHRSSAWASHTANDATTLSRWVCATSSLQMESKRQSSYAASASV